MDIDVPLRELGAIDSTALREAILGQDDVAWHEDESRQESFYVHDRTLSIVMIALEESDWPNGPISRAAGWKLIADVALPVMQEIIRNHYPEGGEVIRAVAASLSAGANIKAHSDIHQSFHCAHRIHVPISTNPKVWFTINGRPYQLKLGQAYEINNQKQHSVVNRGTEDRITFIFDYIPPGPLAYEPARGRKRPESLSIKPAEVSFRIPPEISTVAR
jgi:quercetin dioxygenase-like cupin family protein